MGLYRRKDSQIWWMCFTSAGEPVNRSTGTADKKLAEKIFGKVQTQVIEGKWFDIDQASKTSYDEMMDRFMSEHAPTKSSEMQRSYKSIKNNLDSYFSGMTLAQIINSDSVERYLLSRPVSPATRNRERAMLSKAFNLAFKWKMCRVNPCTGVPREDEKNKNFGQCLPEEMEAQLLDACEKRLCGQLKDIVIIALQSGCRRREVGHLIWSNINFTARQFAVIQKGGGEKICPMTAKVQAILESRSKVQSISGYVFVNPETRQPWHLRTITKEFKSVAQEIRLTTFRFHDLRHTCGTRLGRAEVDLHTIASVLGHSQLSTTQRYVRHNTEGKRKALEKVFKDETKDKGEQSATG